MHISIPMNNTIEYINAIEISPLIDLVNVKVCYVGQIPNRNDTVITRELAAEMGRKLPGSPIVGCYNKETKDFGGHDKEVKIQGGKFELVDMTRPYGFVPTDAKVWFQKFNDEGIEHEYLCTQCYIWTGIYPESQRITDKGNNQSMELNDEFSKGSWTEDINSNRRFFIYSEALIEKLCLLGETVEPCFEGAQFKTEFSLEDEQTLRKTMFSMMNQLQEILRKGGSQETMQNEDKILSTQGVTDFVKKPTDEEKEEKKETNKEANNPQGNTGTGSEGDKDNKDPKKNNKEEEEEDPKDKKKKYNLSEVTEYSELLIKYNELQNAYSNLQQEKSSLDSEIANLRQFKLETDRKNKQSMIDSFYMLSDTDKKDVIDHIDTYSLSDIEAKLSIICVRNKVNFEKQEEHTTQTPQGLFNLNGAFDSDDAPAWVKAVRENARK